MLGSVLFVISSAAALLAVAAVVSSAAHLPWYKRRVRIAAAFLLAVLPVSAVGLGALNGGIRECNDALASSAHDGEWEYGSAWWWVPGLNLMLVYREAPLHRGFLACMALWLALVVAGGVFLVLRGLASVQDVPRASLWNRSRLYLLATAIAVVTALVTSAKAGLVKRRLSRLKSEAPPSLLMRKQLSKEWAVCRIEESLSKVADLVQAGDRDQAIRAVDALSARLAGFDYCSGDDYFKGYMARLRLFELERVAYQLAASGDDRADADPGPAYATPSPEHALTYEFSSRFRAALESGISMPGVRGFCWRLFFAERELGSLLALRDEYVESCASLGVPDGDLVYSLRGFYSKGLTTNWHHMQREWYAMDQVSKSVRCAMAFIVKNGSPPRGWQDLVPRAISAIPEDPFTEQDLRLNSAAGVTVIYSVGPNRRDDGGTPGLDLVLFAKP